MSAVRLSLFSNRTKAPWVIYFIGLWFIGDGTANTFNLFAIRAMSPPCFDSDARADGNQAFADTVAGERKLLDMANVIYRTMHPLGGFVTFT